VSEQESRQKLFLPQYTKITENSFRHTHSELVKKLSCRRALEVLQVWPADFRGRRKISGGR
jgi:hypothetical protein